MIGMSHAIRYFIVAESLSVTVVLILLWRQP